MVCLSVESWWEHQGVQDPAACRCQEGAMLKSIAQSVVWNCKSPFSHRNKAQVEVGSPPGPKEPDSANSSTASEDPPGSPPLSVAGGGTGRGACGISRDRGSAGSSAKGSGGHGNGGPAEGSSHLGERLGNGSVYVWTFLSAEHT